MEDKERKELHKKIYVHLLICLLTVLLIIFVVPWLARLMAPLIVAWIIALMANPLVRFLENKIKIVRKHGSVIVIVAVIAIIGIVLYLLVSAIVSQVSSLIVELPDLYTTVFNNLQDSLSSLHSKYNIIPKNIQSVFEGKESNINDYIMTALNSISASPVSTVSSVASSLIDWFVLFILTTMLTYFFVADNEKIKKAVKEHTPVGIQNSWNMIKNTIVKAIGGYLKACGEIMIVIFIILFIIFGIMGVQYAVLIALITAVLDFLPFVGTGTVLMPWAVYNIITGNYRDAIFLVAAYFITLIARRLLEPKLVGDSVGMSPFLTLISMFIGYRLIGMLGLIIGIPVGMILQVFYEEGIFDNTINGIKILANDINEYRKFW